MSRLESFTEEEPDDEEVTEDAMEFAEDLTDVVEDMMQSWEDDENIHFSVHDGLVKASEEDLRNKLVAEFFDVVAEMKNR